MIHLTYLGTAAAEGIPALFCRCPACLAAAESGGQEQRCRSSVIINGHLLVDLSPDIYLQKLRNKLDLAEIDTLLITHSHSDHLDAQELTRRSTANYCTIPGETPLTLYGNQKVCDTAHNALAREFGDGSDPSLNILPIAPYDVVRSRELTITALPAHHDPAEDCLIYLIADDDGHTMLYCNDSGLPDASTIAGLSQALSGQKLGFVSMDCTFGLRNHSFDGHMGLAENKALRNILLESGCANEATRYVATHFSHNCGLSHRELEKAFAPENITVAYDGMEIIL